MWGFIFYLLVIHQGVNSQPIEMFGSGLGVKRVDSVNPYCHICSTLWITLAAPDFSPKGRQCETLVPLNEQEVCNYVRQSMAASSDVQLIAKFGCVDNTAPDEIPLSWPVGQCPGLVACNIMESESGGPMCGPSLRAWGDFDPKVSWNRPIRPNPLDLAPKYMRKIDKQVMRYMEANNAAGNPNCQMCIDIINGWNVKKVMGTVASGCSHQPLALADLCKSLATELLAVPRDDLDHIMGIGCIDFTTTMPIIKPAMECSGLVACNLIQTPRGGPYCGGTLGVYGRMNLGAALRPMTEGPERRTGGLSWQKGGSTAA